jgi:hypothetical protein
MHYYQTAFRLFFAFTIALTSLRIVAADEILPVESQDRCTFGKAMELSVPGLTGHSMALVENRCTLHKSTGKFDLLNDGQSVHYVFRDYRDWRGPVQGYARLSRNADSLIVSWSGTTTATPTADGNLSIHFQGEWKFEQGTGQFAGIKGGSGIWSGRVLSDTELESHMSGTLIR